MDKPSRIYWLIFLPIAGHGSARLHGPWHPQATGSAARSLFLPKVRSWRSGWLGVSQPTFLPQFPPMSPKFLCLFPRMQNFLLRMSSFALNSRFLKDILTGISWCTVACQGLRFPGERPGFSGNPPPTRERSEQEKRAWRTDQHSQETLRPCECGQEPSSSRTWCSLAGANFAF